MQCLQYLLDRSSPAHSGFDKMANITDMNGIAGANFDIYGANRVLPRAMTAFTAIAWYNSIELLILIFVIFNKYSGLYFWSLIVNASSIVPYATGMTMFVKLQIR
jgi:hypothetical protein